MIETGCFGCNQSDWDADGCTCKRFKRFVPNPSADCRYRDTKRMSNADRIRQMTDRELASILCGQCTCCAYQITDCTEKQYVGCEDGVLEWLKQESEVTE